jgi:WD repeat-containing protein mio
MFLGMTLIQQAHAPTGKASILSFILLMKQICRSEERKEALQLCGWPVHGSRDEVTQFVNQLEQNGFATRAAAIAVFHLHIRLAIDVLNRSASKGSEGSLQIVAMALSGS